MQYFSTQQRQAALRALPQRVQEAVLSQTVDDAFRNLLNRYKLRVDEADTLSDETNLLMVGLTKPEEFEARLARRLPTLPETQRSAVIREISATILKPIRDEFRETPAATSPQTSPLQANEKPPLPTESIEKKLTEVIHAPLETTTNTSPKPASLPHPYTEGDPYREPIK